MALTAQDYAQLAALRDALCDPDLQALWSLASEADRQRFLENLTSPE